MAKLKGSGKKTRKIKNRKHTQKGGAEEETKEIDYSVVLESFHESLEKLNRFISVNEDNKNKVKDKKILNKETKLMDYAFQIQNKINVINETLSPENQTKIESINKSISDIRKDLNIDTPTDTQSPVQEDGEGKEDGEGEEDGEGDGDGEGEESPSS